MRVLVTGGAGFIGSHVVDLLLNDGHQVTVLDNLDAQVHGLTAALPPHLQRHTAVPHFDFVRGDIRDVMLVEELLGRCENVIHLAAAVGVGQSMYAPEYYADVNVRGQATLMQIMARDPQRFRRFIVASSMSVYGEGAYECAQHGEVLIHSRAESRLESRIWDPVCPICGATVSARLTRENKQLLPASIYAITKQTQEQMALCFGEAYDVPTLALRFFNVFGSRQALSNPYTGAAAIFCSRLLNGEPPLVFEDGEQSRDFIHVTDVARAVASSLQRSHVPTVAVNVCTGKATSVGQLAQLLCEELRIPMRPKVVSRYRVGDIRHCVGDPAVAQREIGFSAGVGLETGIKEFVEWVRIQHADDHLMQSISELETRKLLR